jgi:hypothetical protein
MIQNFQNWLLENESHSDEICSSSFAKWLSEADEKTVMNLAKRQKKKAEQVVKYGEQVKKKSEDVKKNNERSINYKKKAEGSSDPLNKQINTNRANIAKMKTQIGSIETKTAMMKQKLSQEELANIELVKKKAEMPKMK